MDARKVREKAFHDQEYAEEVRWQAVDKYYSIIDGRARFWEDFLRARCAGKRVLEYGCGQGKYTPRLAEFGGNVTGIDLSETAVANARAGPRAFPGWSPPSTGSMRRSLSGCRSRLVTPGMRSRC